MKLSRKIVTFALLFVVVLVGASPASASSTVTTTERVVNETVNWTLDPANCLSISDPLSGTGERTMVTTTKVFTDGSQQILINDLVKGTAADSSGTYNFVYNNHSIQTIPLSGSPIQVVMTDSFVLNGNGSAPHIKVGFNWRWTYTPPAEYWPPVDNFQQIQTTGDPFTCDPI